MRANKIRDFFEQQGEVTLVQAYIDKGLAQEVRSQLKKEKQTWASFLEACFKKYLKESGK